MRTVIYYFTSTGNSLKIARDLAGELGGEAELVFIPDVVGREKIETDADAVGVVFPVYMLGEPLIVSDFMKKLSAKNGAYIFVVCNYSGMGGNALRQAEAELKGSGNMLSAAFGFKMPNNYTPLVGALPREKQESLFEAEREKVREIAAAVRERKAVPLGGFLPWTALAGLVWKLASPTVPACGRNFWVSEGCTSCGICAKVCPVDNIVMEDGRPKWLDSCQSCVACLQWCPEQVIQYGKFTKGRERYHNPEVSVSDIIRKDKSGQ
jgi:MinD superfamily P-loop ATPase containing an inserted ferredoxin domain